MTNEGLRNFRNKLKLLYLKQILEKHTDSENGLSHAEIMEMMQREGLDVQPRTLRDDIQCLQDAAEDFDLRIETNIKDGKDKAHPIRYRVEERLFTSTEVKLLMESVKGIHSLSEEATKEIQKKLTSLCSSCEAAEIRSQLAVVGGFKAYWSTKRKRDILLNNIEVVDRAIAQDKKIQFRYFWYKSDKRPTYPRDKNHVHVAAPLVRVLENGYYYLVVLDEEDNLYHYRMDRMTNPEIINEMRGIGEEHFVNGLNWTDYVNSSMGMGFTNAFSNNRFGSLFSHNVVNNRKYTVRMRFTRDMVGVVLDRFGTDVWIVPDDKGHFIASFEAYYNQQFVGWVLNLGNKVKILSPEFMSDHISYYARATGRWHKRVNGD